MSDIESTVDKFQLRHHFRFGKECLGAEWKDNGWNMHRGSQAYMGTFVHNYPNFVMLSVVPTRIPTFELRVHADSLQVRANTFPAFNSVIYAIEVQVAYISQALIKPILDDYASTIEVNAEAEERSVRGLDDELSVTVFSAGCSNWYINKAGRNSAAWPGLASTFWRATMFPRWKEFVMEGGSVWWPFRKAVRVLSRRSSLVVLAALAVVAGRLLASPVSVYKSVLATFSPANLPEMREKIKMLFR